MGNFYKGFWRMIQERIDKAVSMVDVIMKKAFKGTSIGENTGASCMIWYACSEHTAAMIGHISGKKRTIAKWTAVERAYWQHRKCCEKWQEGEPERAWKDCDGYLCIRYESGRWWHYRWEADGHLVWW